MKIAITTSGRDLDAPMDPRFGRAGAFVLVDTDGDICEIVDNAQNLSAPQGAGIQAAKTVIDRGAEALVTGNCGPKAYRALAAGGVKVFLCDGGTVRQALAKFKAGDLSAADGANVEGHWA